MFAADGRTPLGVATNSGADLTEFFPMVKPMPKNKAHKITSPKNSMSILPVPNVISVSVSGSTSVALAGLIGSMFLSETSRPSWFNSNHECTKDTRDCKLYFAAEGSPFASNFWSPEKKSTGTGKTTVVFFSTPISVKVCRYRNCTLTGSVARR